LHASGCRVDVLFSRRAHEKGIPSQAIQIAGFGFAGGDHLAAKLVRQFVVFARYGIENKFTLYFHIVGQAFGHFLIQLIGLRGTSEMAKRRFA
jgi:hypothetical protein